MIIHVFGYLYGVLQDSFFVYVRQLFKLVRLPMASGISMFREGPLHIAASLCPPYALQALFNQHEP